MNRLKVLVLALVAVGLWAAHLTMTTPSLAARAVEQASAPLLAAPAAVAQRIEQARSELQGAALKLLANPVTRVKPSAKVEAPNADRFNQVRAAAVAGLSDASKTSSFLLVSNEAGTLMAQGSAEPGPPPEGFDVAQAVAGGNGDGVLMELNGVPCLFFSVPVVVAAGSEVKPQGAIVIGGPLWGSFANVNQLAEAVAKDLNLAGLGLWMRGQLAGVAGKKETLEKAFKAAKPGQTVVVEQGPVTALGPLKLPMLTGSANALELAARRDIPGTPFEVLAVASARPVMEALAASQKMAVFMLAGLLLAGLLFTLLVSNGSSEEEDDRPLPQKAPVSLPPEPRRVEPLAPPPSLLKPAPPPPVQEASPDDFNFPPAPAPAKTEQIPASRSVALDGPAEDPFTQAAPPAAPTVPQLSLADDDFENQRTTAYPSHKLAQLESSTDAHPALDPFALAGGPTEGGGAPAGGDFNPDATRVAAIPPELLKASSRRDATTQQSPAYKAPTVSTPKIQSIAPVGGGSEEEHHFQETFRDFLATRQKCGEANDGMTYDKFSAKLRKNKEQLVAKYNCKTVRFQVYVKEGKAALKATPVKD